MHIHPLKGFLYNNRFVAVAVERFVCCLFASFPGFVGSSCPGLQKSVGLRMKRTGLSFAWNVVAGPTLMVKQLGSKITSVLASTDRHG